MDNVLSEVNKVFRSVFQNEQLEVNETTTANDVEAWDSLTHLTLISEIQKHFNVKFKITEIMKFKNVGDMCNVLRTKMNG